MQGEEGGRDREKKKNKKREINRIEIEKLIEFSSLL